MFIKSLSLWGSFQQPQETHTVHPSFSSVSPKTPSAPLRSRAVPHPPLRTQTWQSAWHVVGVQLTCPRPQGALRGEPIAPEAKKEEKAKPNTARWSPHSVLLCSTTVHSRHPLLQGRTPDLHSTLNRTPTPTTEPTLHLKRSQRSEVTLPRPNSRSRFVLQFTNLSVCRAPN